MDAMGAQEASKKYHIFLSFRGQGNCKAFTSHLYSALKREGFHTFRDADVIELGDEISSALKEAIQQSISSIIIFSSDYASSMWCLDELVLILERRRTSGHIVLPVFYDVSPSDVEHQAGSINNALGRNYYLIKGDDRTKEDKMNQWRTALKEVAGLSCGKKLADYGDESELIEEVIKINGVVLTPRPTGIQPQSRIENDAYVQNSGGTDTVYNPAPSEESERFEASSSSAASRYKYHIFLSFRGVEIRKGFASHLYSALVRAGFATFKDDHKIELGEEISLALKSAIEQSMSSIILFSKDYASSTWCLDELVMILNQRRTIGHKVLPIIYDVPLTDVQNQSGSFAEPFMKHYNEPKTKGKMDGWVAALREVGGLTALELAHGDESEFIEKIIKRLDLRTAPRPGGTH